MTTIIGFLQGTGVALVLAGSYLIIASVKTGLDLACDG